MRCWLTAILLLGVLLPGPTLAKGRKAPADGSHSLRFPTPAFHEPTWDDWLMDLRSATGGASVGRANMGALFGAQEMPLRGPTWRFMSVVEQRKTNFGNPDLIALLIRASTAVAEEFPGSVLLVGNMGLAQGGKIVQSKSHQSGRDVDIAYFVLDRKGHPVESGTFVHIKASGKGSDGLTLDVARTWAFVRAMVSSTTPAVQWLFASKGVTDLLLKHAEAIGESEAIVDRARQVLHQPSDSNPHDDHFHVRIHCSEMDLMVGCEEYGTQRPWLVRNMTLVEDEAHRLYERARLGHGGDRAVAAKRLALVQSPKVDNNLEALLCSTDDRVVEAAAEGLLRRLPAKAEELLLRHLKCAKSGPSALLMLKPSQYRLADGVAREAAELMSDYCTPARYGSENAELCAVAAAVLGRSRDFRYSERLLQFLEALPAAQQESALQPLQTLYLVERPQELLVQPNDPQTKGKEGSASGADTKVKGKKGKKGKKRAAAQTQPPQSVLQAWKAVARKVGDTHWTAFAKERLRALGVLKQGPVETKQNIKRLAEAVRHKGPAAFAAQILLSSLLEVPMPYFMTGERATAFWAPKIPKSTSESPQKSKERKAETAPPPKKMAPPPPDFEP